MMKKALALGAAAVAVSLTLAGCASGSDTQNVKTDYGVTPTQIKLGSLSDFSKVFAGSAPQVQAGIDLYFADRNKNNPICGRQVVIDTQDHASDNAKVVTLFQAMEPNILALAQVLGSPQQAAVQSAMASAGVTGMVAGWSSTTLVTPSNPNNKYWVPAGTTYPLDIINGLSWLQDTGKIKKGDNIGYINIPGGFGADSFEGGKYFGEKAGYTMNQVVVSGQETDLSGQVNGLLAKGITALVVSGSPGAVNPAVAAVKASNKNIPVLIQNPGYTPAFVAPNAPLAGFYQSNVFIATSVLPISEKNATNDKVVAQLQEAVKAGKYKETIIADAVNNGYSMAAIMGPILDAACKSGDMTRAGVNAAVSTLTKVKTGITPDLDFTNRSKSPSTSTYIWQPDASALGKSKLLKDVGTSEIAKQYQAK